MQAHCGNSVELDVKEISISGQKAWLSRATNSSTYPFKRPSPALSFILHTVVRDTRKRAWILMLKLAEEQFFSHMKSTTLLWGWLREDWIEIENVSLFGARVLISILHFFLTCRHDSEWNLFTYLAERKSHNIQHRKFSGEWFLIRRERRSSIQILEIVRICRGRRSWEGNSTIRNCFFLAYSYLFSVDFSFCLLPSFVSPPLPSLCKIAMRIQCWGWEHIRKSREVFSSS